MVKVPPHTVTLATPGPGPERGGAPEAPGVTEGGAAALVPNPADVCHTLMKHSPGKHPNAKILMLHNDMDVRKAIQKEHFISMTARDMSVIPSGYSKVRESKTNRKAEQSTARFRV